MLSLALCLPAPDVAALISGRTITALPKMFISPGRVFALYPVDSTSTHNSLDLGQIYQPGFLNIAQEAQQALNPDTVFIKAWARCVGCQEIDSSQDLEAISRLTIWRREMFENLLQSSPPFFLGCLQVYRLSEAIPLSIPKEYKPEVGKFFSTSSTIPIPEEQPIINDRQFNRRLQKLRRLEAPDHPEMEELQALLATKTDPAARKLEARIYQFLGWGNHQFSDSSNPDLTWINNIADLGNRSKEEEETSNYAAGTAFENIVRQSLEFLGFTVDYFHKGGAGGVDVFCKRPYPLVIECKSGKKIPNTTAVQLRHLANLRLKDPVLVAQAVKLIIGPGEPTTQLKEVAELENMSILNPETLENLVKLHSQHPNCINLFELKGCLKEGDSNDSVEEYIKQVNARINLRSHIIQVVKECMQKTEKKNVTISKIHTAYCFWSEPPCSLSEQELQDILIELSSPLMGYLGRVREQNPKDDRFYFLRDLVVE